MAAADLYDQADALLDACIALLGSRAPATAFVSPSEPIYDCCPMLAVSVVQLGEAFTSPAGTLDAGHRTKFSRVNTVSFNVHAVRCDTEVAAQTLPDVDAKQGVAMETYADGWTLWNGLYRMVDDGTLFRGCGERYLDAARPIDSSGGCVGFLISLRASLPGYDPFNP